MVRIEMENGGIIDIELYEEKAPITVKNFIKLVSEGFYDGLIFHRVMTKRNSFWRLNSVSNIVPIRKKVSKYDETFPCIEIF